MADLRTSVALCTFNGERFLVKQLDSMLTQTHLPDEIIICDDASQDATVEILKRYRTAHPKIIKLIENPKNIGYKKNFEQAISLCSHDIILLSDQDDIWQPYRIELTINAFKEQPELGYFFSDALLIDSNDIPSGRRLWQSLRFNHAERNIFSNTETQAALLFQKNYVTGATLAFRSIHRNLILPFPASNNWVHDHWIALILSMASFYGKAIESPLISYRIHDAQQIGVGKRTNPSAKRKKTVYGKLVHKKNLVDDVHKYANEALRNNEDYRLNMLKFNRMVDARLIALVSPLSKRWQIIKGNLKSGLYNHFAHPWREAFKDLLGR